MKRPYYKEPDTTYGRPEVWVSPDPPQGFSLHGADEFAASLDLRGFLNEVVRRESIHEFRQNQGWAAEAAAEFLGGEAREFAPALTTADEINRFLVRPEAVCIVGTEDAARHALHLGMILIAVDPNVPDLAARLEQTAKAIRQSHPVPAARPPGRQAKTGDIDGFHEGDVRQWRDHRILALLDLVLVGHDPRSERKQLAAWLFPEIEDLRARGKKLDHAIKLLNALRAAVRVIDAQTRS